MTTTQSTGGRLYQPLQDGCFRLVRLHPDKLLEPKIVCELVTFVLDDTEEESLQSKRPDFIALSYVWGTEEAQERITLNGKSFPVRPNLYGYMTTMKAERYLDWFFIDAICINQDDQAERARQVGLMPRIYSTAKEVLGWLGFVHHSHWNQFGYAAYKELRQGSEIADETIHAHMHVIESSGGPNVELLLLNSADNPYWSRLWVTQEVILAPRLYLLVACKARGLEVMRMDWRELAIGLEHISPDFNPPNLSGMFVVPHLREKSDRYYFAKNLSAAIAILAYKRTQNRLGRDRNREDEPYIKHRSFREVISAFTSQECSLRHDKIFGLLGLTNSNMKVDYNMDISELYIRTLAEGLISIHEDLISGLNPSSEPKLSDLKLEYQFLMGLLVPLIYAFRLPTLHPLLLLLTELVLLELGTLWVSLRPRSFWPEAYLEVQFKWHHKTRHIPGRKRMLILKVLVERRHKFHWLRRKAKSGERLSFPGDGKEPKTVQEWVAEVTAVVEDVMRNYVYDEKAKSIARRMRSGELDPLGHETPVHDRSQRPGM